MPDPISLAISSAINSINSIGDNKYNLGQLIQQLGTPLGVIPFVGAGLSGPFGFPGWGEFLITQAKKAGTESEKKVQGYLDAKKYEEAAEAALNARGYLAFQAGIRNSFGDEKLVGKLLGGAVALLPKLTPGPVITTNYDHVLEEVFKQASRPFEYQVLGARSDMAVRALQQNRRFLLKIHGDVDDITDRILLKNDYQRHYGSSDSSNIDLSLPLPRLLFMMFLSRPLLFLGCSLEQNRALQVLKAVVEIFRSIEHYAIVKLPDSDEEFYERSRFLANHNIYPIWYPKGEYSVVEELMSYLVTYISPLPLLTRETTTSVPSVLVVNNPVNEKPKTVRPTAKCKVKGTHCSFFALKRVEYSEPHCQLKSTPERIRFIIQGQSRSGYGSLHECVIEVREQGESPRAEFSLDTLPLVFHYGGNLSLLSFSPKTAEKRRNSNHQKYSRTYIADVTQNE